MTFPPSPLPLPPYICCRYSKEEGLEPGSPDLLQYQFLVVSAVDYMHYSDSHKIVGKAKGFSTLSLSWGIGFPLRTVLEDRILVLQRK